MKYILRVYRTYRDFFSFFSSLEKKKTRLEIFDFWPIQSRIRGQSFGSVV